MYTCSIFTQKQVHAQIINTPHDPHDWLNGQRTCCSGIMALVQLNMAIMDGFRLFLIIFFLNHWPIAYIAFHCCFGRYLSFVFDLFLLFHFFTRTSFISLFNYYAHLGKYVHIFIRTYHARNTTAVPSPCR